MDFANGDISNLQRQWIPNTTLIARPLTIHGAPLTIQGGCCVASLTIWSNPVSYSYNRPNSLHLDRLCGKFRFLPIVLGMNKLLVYANILRHLKRIFSWDQTSVWVNTSMAIFLCMPAISVLDSARYSQISSFAVSRRISAVADVPHTRVLSHQAFYFEPEIFRQWVADESDSRRHVMRDYFEKETVLYAYPRRTCVRDGVPGIEIFPLRVKMMCAAINEHSGLVVVVANCCISELLYGYIHRVR